MKILFISRELNGTSGAGVGARMHLTALKHVVGENNVMVIDVSTSAKPEKRANYVAYGKYKSKLDRIIRALQGNTFYFSDRIIINICNLIKKEKIDFVFVDDSFFGKFVKKMKENYPNIPVVSFYHDVKRELFPKWIKRSPWFDKINYWIGMKNEQISYQYVDANIVLNHNEDRLLKKYYGGHADYYLPVSVNKEENHGKDPYAANGQSHILFVGTAYYPNIQGIKWFYQNIFTKIDEHYDLWIVGKGLECLSADFEDKQVHVVGFVESLTPYYLYSDVVIAPLYDGGGMKIKTAEAISFGKTFFGSSESLEGYYEEMPENLKNKVVYQCDTEQEYLYAFDKYTHGEKKLCCDSLLNLYLEKYSQQAATRTIKNILSDLKGEIHS